MMEENNDIFLGDGDASGRTNAQKIFHKICVGPSIQYVRILRPIFQPPPHCTHMYSLKVTPLLHTSFHRFDTLLSHFDFARLPQFFILLYFTNSRTDVFVSDTHHFLASHSVSSSLTQNVFSLMVASKCQLFYLS